ncbi:MAG: alanine racemase [Deinococcales bacterium]
MARAYIDLKAIGHNVGCMRQWLRRETPVLAAVKANAYGHGAVEVASFLSSIGLHWFGVATAWEALALKEAGVQGHILIFSPCYETQWLQPLISHDVRLCLANQESLQHAEMAAKALGKKAHVHLKVDSGMGRMGVFSEEALAFIEVVARSPYLILEGLFSHFACADEADLSYSRQQLSRFADLLAALRRGAIEIPIIHMANSAAIVSLPESHFDMVRLGIALYGYAPSKEIAAKMAAKVGQKKSPLQAAMRVTAPVNLVKRIKMGQSVSYGAIWRADKDSTLATVRFGYADGLPRTAQKAKLFAAAKLRPIRGRICMDQLMIDMDDDEIAVGDEVTILAGQGPNADDLAKLAKTISYEILCGISPRVERVYL